MSCGGVARAVDAVLATTCFNKRGYVMGKNRALLAILQMPSQKKIEIFK